MRKLGSAAAWLRADGWSVRDLARPVVARRVQSLKGPWSQPASSPRTSSIAVFCGLGVVHSALAGDVITTLGQSPSHTYAASTRHIFLSLETRSVEEPQSGLSFVTAAVCCCRSAVLLLFSAWPEQAITTHFFPRNKSTMSKNSGETSQGRSEKATCHRKTKTTRRPDKQETGH